MSSYESLPRKAKIAAREHGRKRITVHDRSSVGCPKVMEVWVPNHKWSSVNVPVFLDSLYSFAAEISGAEKDSLYFEP